MKIEGKHQFLNLIKKRFWWKSNCQIDLLVLGERNHFFSSFLHNFTDVVAAVVVVVKLFGLRYCNIIHCMERWCSRKYLNKKELCSLVHFWRRKKTGRKICWCMCQNRMKLFVIHTGRTALNAMSYWKKLNAYYQEFQHHWSSMWIDVCVLHFSWFVERKWNEWRSEKTRK